MLLSANQNEKENNGELICSNKPSHALPLEKHYKKIVDECYTRKSSDIFFYLPSTTDRKESINQYKDNVSLKTIDCNYENFENFHSEQKELYPQHLDLNVNDERRKVAVEILYNIFNDLCEAPDSNLIRNTDHLLANPPRATNEEIVWIGENTKIFDDSKFKLTY